MGCFNQACAISGIDIRYGDDCMVLSIQRNQFEDGRIGSINDHAWMFWKPFWFPIQGKYNDYGGIEKIKMNWNTAALEAYFDIPIKDIVRLITSNRDEFYGSCSDFWKVFGRPTRITKKSLAKIGFETNRDRYLTHPEIDALLINKFNPWLIMRWKTNGDLEISGSYVRYNSGNDSPLIYKFNDDAALGYCSNNTLEKSFLETLYNWYEKAAQKSPDFNKKSFLFGYPKELNEKIFLLHQLRPAFIRTDVYNKFLEESKKLKTKADPETFSKLQYGLIPPAFSDGCILNQRFPELYKKYSATLPFQNALRDFNLLQWGLVEINRTIVPTYSLQQHGDVGRQIKLLNVFKSVASAVKKKRKS